MTDTIADPPDLASGSTRWPLASRPAGGGRPVVFGEGARSVVVGGPELAIIAGPCAVEGAAMLRDVALAVRAAGASALRGGAFKPRTSPYSFQGLGEAALEMLAEVRAETGLPVVTEVMDPRQVERVSAVADVLQVGARNMHNSALLTEVGRGPRPVLLKRGFAARLDEFLLAAEYVLAAGNAAVILCERGVRGFETATRNTLDVAAIPLLKAETHLPVIVDPSHAGGSRALVLPLSLAAVAAGADGLLVEVHPDPDAALSDAEQSLSPREFGAFLQRLGGTAVAAERRLRVPPSSAAAPGRGTDAGAAAALAALRGLIADTDHAILGLVHRRAELARAAGDAKRALGMPVVDPTREREVEQLIMDRARALALPGAHIQSIARALIGLARTVQGGEEHSE